MINKIFFAFSLLPKKSASVIYVHVYYNRRTLTKYAARLEYTFLSMTAYIGGVFGLFWGASVLSLVEMVYAIIRFIIGFIWKKCNTIRRTRRIATTLNVIYE